MNNPHRPPELSRDLKEFAEVIIDQSRHHHLKDSGRRAELAQEYAGYGLPGWFLIVRDILWMDEDRSLCESALATAKDAIPIVWPASFHGAAGREAEIQVLVAQCLHRVWSAPESFVEALTRLSEEHNVPLEALFRIAKAYRSDLVMPEELSSDVNLKEITLPLLFVGSTSGEGQPGKLTIRASHLKGRGTLVPDLAMSLIERNSSWMEMENTVRGYLAQREIWPESSSLDLEWRIDLVGQETQPLFALSGGSAGATFTLGLCTLLDRDSIFRPGFVSRLAISATISPEGVLGKVNGTESKLNSLRNRFFPPVRAVALSQEGFVFDASDKPKDRDPDVWQAVPLNHIKEAGDLPAGFILRNQVESFDLVNAGETFDQLIIRVCAYQRSFHWEENPYRSLDYFGLEHASIFFGRETETAELHELYEKRESDENDGCAFVAIIGSSGSGKSSFARAGFAASLISPPPGTRLDAEWHFVGLAPSQMAEDFALAIIDQIILWKCVDSDILDRIALAKEFKDDPEKFLSDTLPELIGNERDESARRPKLLLMIDQFEEICTIPQWSKNDSLIRGFLGFLRKLSRSGNCRVLITVRSDYDSAVESLPGYTNLVGNRLSNFIIRPPQEDRLRAIITRPAEAAGAVFETVIGSQGTTLADRLLAAINQKANALPLLQFTLYEIYEKCQNLAEKNEAVVLSNAIYDEEIGGVEGSIARHAESIYVSLAEQIEVSELESAFKTVFSRLVTAKDDSSSKQGGWTGVPKKESGLIDPGVNREIFMKVLNAFDQGRILETRKDNSEESEPTYFLRHDSVIPSWPRLMRLAEENLKYQITLKQITTMLRVSNQGRKNREIIPKGSILANAQSLRNDAPHLLDMASKDFVDRSIMRNHLRSFIGIATLVCVISILSTLLFLNSVERKKTSDALKRLALSKIEITSNLETVDGLIGDIDLSELIIGSEDLSKFAQALVRNAENKLDNNLIKNDSNYFEDSKAKINSLHYVTAQLVNFHGPRDIEWIERGYTVMKKICGKAITRMEGKPGSIWLKRRLVMLTVEYCQFSRRYSTQEERMRQLSELESVVSYSYECTNHATAEKTDYKMRAQLFQELAREAKDTSNLSKTKEYSDAAKETEDKMEEFINPS